MLSRTESACLGDASIGVARNPLRDGAPPTGLSTASEQDVRPAGVHEVLRRASSSAGSAAIDLGHGVCRPRSGGLRRGVTVTGFGIRQDHAVHTSKTIGSKATVSPRAAACDATGLCPALAYRGACVAPCEPGRFPSSQGQETRAHMVPRLARLVRAYVSSPLRVTPKGESRRIRDTSLRGRDSIEEA
jgi:hypothetical protein